MREDVRDLVGRVVEPSWVRMVREFQQEKIGYAVLPPYPVPPDNATKVELISSVMEEMEELIKAFALDDLDEAADAVIDTIYVLIGIGLRLGLPLAALFAEVHASNMEKRPAVKGTRGRGAAGGVSMKPPGWEKPRIGAILDAHADSRWDRNAALNVVNGLRKRAGLDESYSSKEPEEVYLTPEEMAGFEKDSHQSHSAFVAALEKVYGVEHAHS